ncbi:MAG: SUMF1/EgtB/PvdO family nonheme iron enzyme, partial [Candidatus Dadabacteria bacterium]|nr:SUMF1/EgtB/PvdO family nonheme iron enzyme [Candidatus Dadabacteria bacterium]
MAAKTKIRRQENPEEKKRYDRAGIPERDYLTQSYKTVRDFSFFLSAPLETEDFVIQSMPDVSPTKWHLAHTSWFFETFLLGPYLKGYREFDPRFAYLFNSYYEAVGARHPRPQRGLLSRPDVATVMAYRAHVEEAMARLLAAPPTEHIAAILALTELGLAHEEQHQELLLMDIKHVFSVNPLLPAYAPEAAHGPSAGAGHAEPVAFPGGLYEIGHNGGGFAFDNEGPRHRVWLEPFALASRPVTVGEYRAFMADGGYARPELWLSDGWAEARRREWTAPLYWAERDGAWWMVTLAGERHHPPGPVALGPVQRRRPLATSRLGPAVRQPELGTLVAPVPH